MRLRGLVRTNCRGLMLLGAVDRRGAFVVGMREVIFPLCFVIKNRAESRGNWRVGAVIVVMFYVVLFGVGRRD